MRNILLMLKLNITVSQENCENHHLNELIYREKSNYQID